MYVDIQLTFCFVYFIKLMCVHACTFVMCYIGVYANNYATSMIV